MSVYDELRKILEIILIDKNTPYPMRGTRNRQFKYHLPALKFVHPKVTLLFAPNIDSHYQSEEEQKYYVRLYDISFDNGFIFATITRKPHPELCFVTKIYDPTEKFITSQLIGMAKEVCPYIKIIY